jgi:branched-subunit amino acid transport protein
MSVTTSAWIVIGVAGLITYLMRGGFLLLARRVAAVPESAREALRMVPAAAVAALVAPALLRPDGAFDPFGPRAIAGAVASVVAWRTRNILATVVVGLVVLVGLERLAG